MQVDTRLLSVEIQFDDGSKVFNQDFNIRVNGKKNITSLQNIATIEISNLDKATRDYILANCNQNRPSQYKVRRVVVKAGRASKGDWQVYVGDIINAAVTLPPDITLVLRCATNARDRTQWKAYSKLQPYPLSTLIQDICDVLNLTPQVDPDVDQSKIIPRFMFNGAAPALVIALQDQADVHAFVDDDKLVVMPVGKSLANTIVEVNKNTGMISIPELTEYGVRVTTLADRELVLGGAIRLTSEINPSINGDYVIAELGYNLTSRETPFYYQLHTFRSA